MNKKMVSEAKEQNWFVKHWIVSIFLGIMVFTFLLILYEC